MTEHLDESLGALADWANSNDVQAEAMRRAGCELSRSQVWLLARLQTSGPVRLGALAEQMNLDKSTLSPQVTRLETDGYVVRTADPTDGRAHLLHVTKEGKALLRRVERSRGAMLRELLSDWPESDLARASRILSKLSSRLGTRLGDRLVARRPRSTRA
jgi:DNA-binding MarR family transcriptional regulator